MSPCEGACLAGPFWGSSWSGHHWGIIEARGTPCCGPQHRGGSGGDGGAVSGLSLLMLKNPDLLTAMHERGRQVLGAFLPAPDTGRMMPAFGFLLGAGQWP